MDAAAQALVAAIGRCQKPASVTEPPDESDDPASRKRRRTDGDGLGRWAEVAGTLRAPEIAASAAEVTQFAAEASQAGGLAAAAAVASIIPALKLLPVRTAAHWLLAMLAAIAELVAPPPAWLAEVRLDILIRADALEQLAVMLEMVAAADGCSLTAATRLFDGIFDGYFGGGKPGDELAELFLKTSSLALSMGAVAYLQYLALMLRVNRTTRGNALLARLLADQFSSKAATQLRALGQICPELAHEVVAFVVDPNRGVDPTIAAKFEGIAVAWVSGQPYLLLPLTGTDSDHPNAAPGGGVAEGSGASFAIIVYFLKKSVEDAVRSPTNPQCGHLHESILKALTLYTQRVADPVTLAKGAASSLTTRVIPGGQWPAGVSAEMLAVATEGATHEAGQLPLSVLRLVQVIAVVHSSGMLGAGEACAVAALLKRHGSTLQNKFVEAIIIRLEGGK